MTAPDIREVPEGGDAVGQHHIGRTVDALAFVEQLDTSGEVDIAGCLRLVTVTTRTSVYEYDPGTKRMRGGVIGPEWVEGRIGGSTFGGSMIAIDRIIPGALLEFYAGGVTYTSSPIESAVIEDIDEYLARRRAQAPR